KTKGFSAGVHAGYLSYTANNLLFEANTGFGFGGFVQYGFSHQLALSLGIQHYYMDPKTIALLNSPYPYTEFDITAKYIFGSTNSVVRPFLALGGNYTTQDEFFEDDIEGLIEATYSGFSGCGGAGVAFFLTNQLSLDISAYYHIGSFGVIQNRIKYDVTYDFTAYKGLAGISYHF
ncbi:MAG: outer membrane beta-barrel protein, partial [Saprospiraceae bacterium]|nr:outer membrane beta-barrel protein [Saprospiraceae bacterium]